MFSQIPSLQTAIFSNNKTEVEKLIQDSGTDKNSLGMAEEFRLRAFYFLEVLNQGWEDIADALVAKEYIDLSNEEQLHELLVNLMSQQDSKKMAFGWGYAFSRLINQDNLSKFVQAVIGYQSIARGNIKTIDLLPSPETVFESNSPHYRNYQNFYESLWEAYWKSQVAHHFGLTGKSALSKFPDITFDLEGNLNEIMIELLKESSSQFFKSDQFFQIIQAEHLDAVALAESISKTFKSILFTYGTDNNTLGEVSEHVSKSLENRGVLPISLSTTPGSDAKFQWHASTVVFCGNYCYIGDRGRDETHENGVTVYEIGELSKVQEVATKLNMSANHELNKQQVQDELDKLKLTKVAHHSMFPQKTGNCTWSSSAKLIFFTAVLAEIHKREPHIEKAIEKTKKIYKPFSTFDRLQIIQNYIAFCKKTGLPLDVLMLGQIYLKAEHRVRYADIFKVVQDTRVITIDIKKRARMAYFEDAKRHLKEEMGLKVTQELPIEYQQYQESLEEVAEKLTEVYLANNSSKEEIIEMIKSVKKILGLSEASDSHSNNNVTPSVEPNTQLTAQVALNTVEVKPTFLPLAPPLLFTQSTNAATMTMPATNVTNSSLTTTSSTSSHASSAPSKIDTNFSDDEFIKILQINFTDPNKNTLNEGDLALAKTRLGLNQEDTIRKVQGLRIQIQRQGVKNLNWLEIPNLLKGGSKNIPKTKF